MEKRFEHEKRLFVDMDGTLAVFKPVDELETLYEQGYFLNLQPQENVVEAIREIITKHPEIEVNILSAYLSDSEYALAEKNKWLDRYLPEIDSKHRIFVPCGTDKKDGIRNGVRKDDFLLDDYTKNLNEWQPPARGIKLLNGINHTRGTWPYDRIRHDRGAVDLANGILSIMRDEKQIYDQKKPSLLESLHKKQDQTKSAEEKKRDRLPDDRSSREKDMRSER
jgi:5'(3')-deoxyribonucleotidase